MLDAPVVVPEVVTPDTKKTGRFASLPTWAKVLIIAAATLLALAFIGSLNKDPVPAAAPAPSAAPALVAKPAPATPVVAPTSAAMSEAELHQIALGMAWNQQSASDQAAMCSAVRSVGYTWAAVKVVSGSDDTFTVSEVTRFLHTKC